MEPLLEQRARLTTQVVSLKKEIRAKREALAKAADALQQVEAECHRRGIGFHIHRPGAEVTHGR